MEQINKFKNYLILGLFAVIGILLLFKGCGTPAVKEVFKQGKNTIEWDTIHQPYKVVEFKTHFYPKWDTIKRADTTWNADLCKFERQYTDSVIDSNITIYGKISTIGILKSIKYDYRWKKPEVIKTISRTDTLTRSSRFSIYSGLVLEGNQYLLNPSPFITLNVNKVSITANYGLINKTYGIGIGYRLYKSKK